MRKIVAALTGATLALSMMAQALPANAVVAGYDSAYSGESDFVALAPGQSNPFQVFFQNTGTTTWTVGTSSQVDLAACQADKVTCNAQDSTEAPWNAGWLSSTRYATTTQTSVAPGGVGTFKYTVTAPAGATAGTYRFNGDLVLASTGALIHPQGYYQDATVGASGGAAIITSLTPNNGSSAGGTTVVIAGTGFTCTPAFPSVSYGTNSAAVTSCGATSITTTSPAGAVGTATVTVTNAGAGPSNGLTYTYADTSRPTFDSFTVAGNLATVTFSEPVCNPTAANTAATDWQLQNVSAAAPIGVTSDSIPTCTAAADTGTTTATLQLAAAIPNGAFTELTLMAAAGTCVPATSATCNPNIVDLTGNTSVAPQSRQTTAVNPETTAPTITAISGAVGTTTLTITFSEPVYCTGFSFDSTDITLTDNNTATTDPTATAAGSNACGVDPTSADTSFFVTLGSALPADRTYVVTLTPEANEIQDRVGNDLANPSSFTFTTGAGDFTPPTIVDARMVNNLATTDFTEVGDSFSLTFSEPMNGTTTGVITAQDQDGTVITMNCSGNVSCTWNTAVTTLTVVVTTAIAAPVGPAYGAGSTPGMQIPFLISTLNGFADLQGNVPNVLGSPDRTVDYE